MCVCIDHARPSLSRFLFNITLRHASNTRWTLFVSVACIHTHTHTHIHTYTQTNRQQMERQEQPLISSIKCAHIQYAGCLCVCMDGVTDFMCVYVYICVCTCVVCVYVYLWHMSNARIYLCHLCSDIKIDFQCTYSRPRSRECLCVKQYAHMYVCVRVVCVCTYVCM